MAALLPIAAVAGCHGAGTASLPVGANGMRVTAVRIGHAAFTAEIAETQAQQAKGLMGRTRLPPDAGMLFWPYPAPVGGKPQPPQVANFWMKDTPSALDILFIRADGTIARVVEAVPNDETFLSSREPVAAVLEIPGGRAAALGVREGDKVIWAK